MSSYNFFINIDQCLNMSNYDMFFYRLQSRNKFSKYDVNSKSGNGPDSMAGALMSARDYISQNGIQYKIRDYRFIFGMRQKYKKQYQWNESLLYHMLNIYYSLADAGIQIKSPDRRDKNVTLIMLYDITSEYDEVALPSAFYSYQNDVSLMLESLHLNEEEILKSFVDESIKTADPITMRFIQGFRQWIHVHQLVGASPELITEDGTDGNHDRYNNVFLTAYIGTLVGAYCTFIKYITNDTLDTLLGPLSIVDYITTGLALTEEGVEVSAQRLKEQAEQNWKEIIDEQALQKKYGLMMSAYTERLNREYAKLEGLSAGGSVPVIPEPVVEEITEEYTEKPVADKVRAGLEQFESTGFNGKNPLSQWKTSMDQIGRTVHDMEGELDGFFEKLSFRYKSEMRARRDALRSYSPDAETLSFEEADRRRRREADLIQSILLKLQEPKMVPELSFRNQLNIENSLERCDREVRHLIRCKEEIRLRTFVLLFLSCFGGFLLLYVLLQESLLTTISSVAAFFAGVVLIAFLFWVSYAAPSHELTVRLRDSMFCFERDVEQFGRSYQEMVMNFREYINLLNELDARQIYLKQVEDHYEESRIVAASSLWHKNRIKEHLRKCEYLKPLSEDYIRTEADAGDINRERTRRNEIVLDLKTDDVHNPLYWPSYSVGEDD